MKKKKDYLEKEGVTFSDKNSDPVIITDITTTCDCCDGPGDDDHECPYQAEIHDDHDTMCNCCANCTQRCSDEV